jgi:hypothetical protein
MPGKDRTDENIALTMDDVIFRIETKYIYLIGLSTQKQRSCEYHPH